MARHTREPRSRRRLTLVGSTVLLLILTGGYYASANSGGPQVTTTTITPPTTQGTPQGGAVPAQQSNLTFPDTTQYPLSFLPTDNTWASFTPVTTGPLWAQQNPRAMGNQSLVQPFQWSFQAATLNGITVTLPVPTGWQTKGLTGNMITWISPGGYSYLAITVSKSTVATIEQQGTPDPTPPEWESLGGGTVIGAFASPGKSFYQSRSIVFVYMAPYQGETVSIMIAGNNMHNQLVPTVVDGTTLSGS